MAGDQKEKKPKEIEDKYNTRKLKLSSFVKNKYLLGGLGLLVVAGAAFGALWLMAGQESDELTALEKADEFAGLILPVDAPVEDTSAHAVNVADAYGKAEAAEEQLEFLLQAYDDHIPGPGLPLEIADLYKELEDTENEQLYVQYAINISLSELDKDKGVALSGDYMSIADLYVRAGDRDKANEYYLLALDILEDQPQSEEIDNAIQYINESLGEL